MRRQVPSTNRTFIDNSRALNNDEWILADKASDILHKAQGDEAAWIKTLCAAGLDARPGECDYYGGYDLVEVHLPGKYLVFCKARLESVELTGEDQAAVQHCRSMILGLAYANVHGQEFVDALTGNGQVVTLAAHHDNDIMDMPFSVCCDLTLPSGGVVTLDYRGELVSEHWLDSLAKEVR